MPTSTTKTSPPSTEQASMSEEQTDQTRYVAFHSPMQSSMKSQTSSPKRGNKLSEPPSPIKKEEPCSSERPREETGSTICLDWARAQRTKTGSLGISQQKTTPWSTPQRLSLPKRPSPPLLSSKNTWHPSPTQGATYSRKNGSDTGKSHNREVTTLLLTWQGLKKWQNRRQTLRNA